MMFKTRIRAALMATTMMFVQVSPLNAMESGDWLVRVGAHSVDPKSNNSTVVNVEAATQLTFNYTYFFKNNWGVEVLAALPFKHDIQLVDGTAVGSTKHLPPTVSLQYHFDLENFQPYIGAGLNYTLFFEEATYGPLAGTVLELDDSWGLAGQIGFDYLIGDKLLLNTELRYIDIDSDASLDGAALTTVAIDPLTFGVSLGRRF